MQSVTITIHEYCEIHQVEPEFLTALHDEGLIVGVFENEQIMLEEEQLHTLEIYTRWYAQMGINAAGIDAITHLLGRIREMQSEILTLRNQLKLHEE